MAKEPFETYQFMDTNNPEPEVNQLLVLQEDGTLLSVNRDIQYITQVQDVKEVIGDVRTCAVFDVSSQHFYVDVDNTSNIIVPDQLVVPQGDGTIYSNSFLIQPETSTAPELMETEIIAHVSKLEPQAQQSEPEVTNSVAENNFTEITLTDAQYNLLEQKGWILLEISERIFVLDTLGLRDITADENLIQKLKNELESATIQPIDPDPRHAEIDDIIPNADSLDINTPHEENTVIKTENELKCEQKNEISEDVNSPKYPEVPIVTSNLDVQRDDEQNVEMNNLSSVVAIHNMDDGSQKCDSIKIKTKYTFSDIPDKIFLGKTVNGKKLYAKITNKIKNISIPEEQMPKAEMFDEPQFISLIQDYIREHPPKIKLNNVITADTVVTQLMRMARVKDSVMGNYVIITKSVTVISENGQEKTRRKPTVIVGEVKHLDDSHNRFVHTPYLLHNLAKPIKISDDPVDITSEFVDFIHIHITETKMIGKPSSQSINVCNRKLSLEVIRDARKRYPTPVQACGACAAVFRSEDALKIHLENHCSGIMSDDVLTIDMDQLQGPSDSYYTIDTGKEKWYACMQCEEKFLKLSNCKKHITTHSKPMKRNRDNEEVSDSEAQEYRCKMCSTKYFHASSLTKHIVKRHIQIQTNK